MSDTKVNNNIRFLRVPENIDEELKKYLHDLERILRAQLSGNLNVSGNLYVGGEIYVPNADGEITQLTDAGNLGN